MFYMSKYLLQGVEVSFINMSCLREEVFLFHNHKAYAQYKFTQPCMKQAHSIIKISQMQHMGKQKICCFLLNHKNNC